MARDKDSFVFSAPSLRQMCLKTVVGLVDHVKEEEDAAKLLDSILADSGVYLKMARAALELTRMTREHIR